MLFTFMGFRVMDQNDFMIYISHSSNAITASLCICVRGCHSKRFALFHVIRFHICVSKSFRLPHASLRSTSGFVHPHYFSLVKSSSD